MRAQKSILIASIILSTSLITVLSQNILNEQPPLERRLDANPSSNVTTKLPSFLISNTNSTLSTKQKQILKTNLFKTPYSSNPIIEAPDAGELYGVKMHRLNNRSIQQCTTVDVTDAYTLNTSSSATYFQFTQGYYLYFYISGRFNINTTLEYAKCQIFLFDELMKTFTQTVSFTNVVEDSTDSLLDEDLETLAGNSTSDNGGRRLKSENAKSENGQPDSEDTTNTTTNETTSSNSTSTANSTDSNTSSSNSTNSTSSEDIEEEEVDINIHNYKVAVEFYPTLSNTIYSYDYIFQFYGNKNETTGESEALGCVQFSFKYQ